MRPTNRTLVMAAAFLLSVAIAPSAFADSSCYAITGNLVANCGFESGAVSFAAYAASNGTAIQGWTGTGNLNFTGVDSSSPAKDGTYSADLGATGTYDPNTGKYIGRNFGTISQTITDLPGGSATLTFWLANQVGSGPNNFFSYSIDGNPSNILNVAESAVYTEYTLNFTATGSDILSFTFENDDLNFNLDDVSIVETGGTSPSATPEPSSLVLLGTGALGLLGAARRRFLTA